MNPEKVGRYEIKSELGRGGMATVYKAYDPRFEREVALKVLPREFLHDPQFRVRFEREAKTIALLEHAAIVPVYDVGEDDGQPYFVMRYMTGGSLSERIKQGGMSVKEAAHFLDRLCPALDEAHEKGIIHRDLKPGNILFDKSSQPYVSDFGIAKTSTGGATVTGGAIIGTPAYMSPEQAQGEKIDGRSDIYALGVILYEMLSGRQPFEADTPMAVVVKHITDPVPHILDIKPELPAEVEPVIEKAMAKDRTRRFQTCKEFAEALDAVVRDETLETSNSTANATRIQGSGKTRVGTKAVAPTRVGARQQPQTAAAFPWVPVIIGVGILGVIAFGGMFVLGLGLFSPAPTATPTEAPATATVAILPPTNTPEAGTLTQSPPSVTPESTATFTPEPIAETLGGADEVAFVANNDIWIMNMDGSDLRQLTTDGATKTDLQWMPDGQTLIFISNKNINTVDAETGVFNTLTSFTSAQYLDAFQVSPDGKQVAISLNRELFIVPFDVDALHSVHSKSSLLNMKGCLSHKGATNTAAQVKGFRWFDNPNKIAWLFVGVENGKPADLIRIHDISACNPDTLYVSDEFPGTRFTMEGYGSNPIIPDFDFDGSILFLLNSFKRNDGWGYLYSYNYELHKGVKIEPLGSGSCCYRDARWSPDKTYVFFAYQDINLGADAQAQFYYVPFGSIGAGANFTPIPMGDFKFNFPKEAPQPALHPAQP
jgi:serine/threonine-protein kinase